MMYVMIDGSPVDLGVAYGYCYLPEVFDDRGAPIALSTAGDKANWNLHPFFEDALGATLWLKDRGVKGQVLRYAHHKPIEKRDESYRPWVTAGVVAQVEGMALREYSPAYAEAADWSKALGDKFRSIDWHALQTGVRPMGAADGTS